jgi:Ricin-type beta-trefoil lectin domain
MPMSLRRALTAVALVFVTIATSTVVFVAPASAGWDPNMPTSWIKRAFFVSTGRPTFLRLDAAYSGGHGSPVHLWTTDNNPAQVWVEEPAAEGGYFYHPGYDRWLCLDFDGDRAWGVPLKVNNCDGSASQRWYWSDRSANATEYGTWLTTHSDNQFCVDVPNSNFVQGQTLQIWGCNGTSAQVFYLSGCLRLSCNGHDPDAMACSLNSVTVRDVSDGWFRVTLQEGQRCQSVWARVSGGAGEQNDQARAVVERFYNGSYLDEYGSGEIWTGTAWTPMFGEVSGWYQFRGCSARDAMQLPRVCSSLFG